MSTDVEASTSRTLTSPSPRTTPVTRFEYRAPVDGIRGLAALAVVLFHADTPGFSRGYAGVDVFFVLTGFLLGSLLSRELAEKQSLDLVGFYFRRMRRLLPLSLLVLVVTIVAHKIFSNPLSVMEHRESFVAAALYHANWRMLFDSADYFATDKASPVQHYWSLSAEEQMSVVFPLLLWLLMMLTRYRAQSWLLVALLGFLGVISALWALLISREYPMWAYLGTFERSYQLLAGAVLACLTLLVDFSTYKDSRIASILTIIGFFGYFVVGFDFGFTSIQVGIISCLLTVVLLASLEANSSGYIGRFLSHPFLRKMGDLSYGVYLWHFPIIIVGDSIRFPHSQPLRTILLVFVSYAVAFPTHWLVEEPMKKYTTESKGKFLILGLIFSILVAVFAWNLLLGDEFVQELYNNAHGLTNSDPPQDSNPSFDVSPSPSIPSPSTSNINTTYSKVLDVSPMANLSPSVSAPISLPRILLGGDSMTARWQFVFDGLLADGMRFKYDIFWASACPWYYADDYWSQFGSLKARCYGLQDNITKALKENKYDIMFLFNWGISRLLNAEKIPVGDPRWAPIVISGVRKSLEKWTPIPDCLARTGGTGCDQPAAPWPHHDEFREILIDASREFNITTLDVRKFFCQETCLAKTPKGKPTWSDFAHQTDDFMREIEHRGKLKLKLRESCIDLEAGVILKSCAGFPSPSS